MDDALRYDRMVESALRGVVREALALAAERGLPGDHHFYIAFRTDHPGVMISDALRERHPNDMTIVIQHQFWGLEVDGDRFQVTLSFAGKPERLSIPLDAVTAFTDPSVRFGLQFEAGQQPADGEQGPQAAKPKGTALAPPSPSGAPAAGERDQAGHKARNEQPGEVVPLDAFRKK